MAADNIKRLGWVDISKGFVILLMVLGHSNLPEVANRWIWSFHMPFFFFISGYFTGFSRPIKDFIYHKTRQLLYPFFIYSIIVLLLLSVALRRSILDLTTEVIFGGWGGIALWFVPVLYLGTIIVRLISEKFLVVSIIIFIFVGSGLCAENIILPWTLSSVPYASVMIMIGRVLKKYNLLKKLEQNYYWMSSTCLIGFLGSFIVSIYYRLDMACNNINPVIQISIGALCGIFGSIALSMMLGKYNLFINKVLKWCGQNTYEIMALSQVIIMTINSFILIHPVLKYFIMSCLIYFAVQMRHFISTRPIPQDPI